MRPQQLKSPFPYNERRVLLEDRIWHIPNVDNKSFPTFQFPGWSDSSFFSNDLPVCMEYCSGNGHWITDKAKNHPEFNWVAVEYDFERARKIWSKLKNENLSNLLIVCGEGLRFTRTYIPSESIHSAYINFPDPWPKRRHAKFRLVQTPFIQELSRVLKHGGELMMVTDDLEYSQQFIAVLQESPQFQSMYPNDFFIDNYPNYGSSCFETLWREQGKIIRYHLYKNNKLES
jgi:tRNA (guanine-N7-)-methyltransferase